MCRLYGVLPEPGGLLEQPIWLLVVGSDLIAYEQAYRLFDADEDHAPPGVTNWVMETIAASVRERERTE